MFKLGDKVIIVDNDLKVHYPNKYTITKIDKWGFISLMDKTGKEQGGFIAKWLKKFNGGINYLPDWL